MRRSSQRLAYASELIATQAVARRTKDAIALADKSASIAAIAAARVETLKKARGLLSPHKIVDCIEAAVNLSFDEGLRFERDQFLACRESPQRAGLVHAFFAERETGKSPASSNGKARALRSIGVIGGGTMGAGIAVALLEADLLVTMIERDQESLQRGRAQIENVYDGLITRDRLTKDAKTQPFENFSGSTSYDALADVDLVIEAVFEDMAVKKSVFAELDRVCKPGAVLATNTSYLDIDELAASISRPSDVLGLHFFSPANIMKLLKIGVPARVSADAVATAFALATKLKKVAVRAGVCDGFIGNRMLAVYRSAADHLMQDGASPYQIDQAIREFGFPMGPYQFIDLAAGDIGWATLKRRAATSDPLSRYVRIGDLLC
jgi:3-hydroxyacyl-CoA dehydrogenase